MVRDVGKMTGLEEGFRVVTEGNREGTGHRQVRAMLVKAL